MDVMETTSLPPGGTYRIVCGWCGKVAEPPVCASCGRDPEAHWFHVGQQAPRVAEGRPTLDSDEVRRLYDDARAAVVATGKPPTVEAIAEQLDRSPRTVRDWRKRFSLE